MKDKNILRIHSSVAGDNELILRHNYSESERQYDEKSLLRIKKTCGYW